MARIPSPTKIHIWIVIGVIIKLGLLWLQIAQERPADIPGFIGATTPDSRSYLDPIDSWIKSEGYTPDYRMPGYGIWYLAVRQFAQRPDACNILIFLQAVIAGISVFFLARTAELIFSSTRLFYMVFTVYAISSYTNLFDSYILSDSLCTSLTIFAIYFFTRYWVSGNRSSLFTSGCLLTWVVFMRPMFLPLLALMIVIRGIYMIRQKQPFSKILTAAIIYLTPFIVVDAIWIIRNYNTHGRIVPLTTSLYAKEFEQSYLLELMDFVKTWGGDRTWWNAGSEMRWFGVGNYLSFENETVTLPSDIYTSEYNVDSLLVVKEYITEINDEKTSPLRRELLTATVKEKLRRFQRSVEREKPFLVYVSAPAILFKRFFVHSGTYNLFNKKSTELNVVELVLKILYSLLYGVVIVTGLLGLVLLLFNVKNGSELLIVFTVSYSIILFPIVLKQIEFRYFLPAFPFMIVSGCWFSNYLMTILSKKKRFLLRRF